MRDSFIKKLVIYLGVGFFTVSIIFSVGCAPQRVKVVYKDDGNQGYSESGHKHKYKKKGGPPAHAPAHGYRAKHQYRYYPSRSVYYDTGRGLYFYLKGSSWEIGASLPSGLRVGLGDYVSMELDTDKPYIHHKEHANKYPPKKTPNKHKKKKKGKKG